MTRFYCTLFDSYYLPKGVAMLRSLERESPEARVFVLCMDDRTRRVLETIGLSNVVCLTLADVEDDDLLRIKPGRTIAEYCWTLTPCLMWRVLLDHPEVGGVTYIDADLLFWRSPEILFDEIGDAPIAITEHRFAPELKQDLEINGRFCVQWVTIMRNAEGLACLSRWRDQCIEWCFARCEDGRMGDQKYLDEWPDKYAGCHILQHVGAGVGPWNYAQYEIRRDPDGRILIDGAPLVFYHFHGMHMLAGGGFERVDPFYSRLGAAPKDIYGDYESRLGEALAEIRAIEPDYSACFKAAPAPTPPQPRSLHRRLLERLGF